MPYIIKRASKGGWDIVRKTDGTVVGHSTNIKDAQGSVAHRMDAEKPKK